MSFEHTKIGRGPLNFFFGMFTGLLAIIYHALRTQILEAEARLIFDWIFAVYIFLIAIYFIKQIMKPRKFTWKVSDEIVVFKSNEVATHEFKKDDIGKIDITITKYPRIKFFMNSKKNITIPGCYFINPDSLFKELMLCGYPVVDHHFI